MCGRIKKRSNMQKYKGVPKAKIEKARLNHSRKKTVSVILIPLVKPVN